MYNILIDYEDSLIGRTPYVDPSNFYGPNAGSANERLALLCIRFAIEKILKWTPDDAVKYFDSYIIRQMKLDKLVSYIDFPIEVEYGNPRYILSLLYPRKVRMTQRSMAESMIKTVLNSTEGKQFPREYFVGGIGFQRYCYCLKYLFDTSCPCDTLDDMYEYMDSPAGKAFLGRCRLKVPAEQYNINIHQAIRYITQDHPDSELTFAYHEFLQQWRKAKSQIANQNKD